MKIRNKQLSIDKRFERMLSNAPSEEARKDMLDMLPLLNAVAVEFYDLAQSDLLESASESFEEYVAQNKGLYFGDGHRIEMDSRVWQACSLYHAKLIKEKDERIKELEEELKWKTELSEAWCSASLALDRLKAKYELDRQERKG